MQTKDKKCYCSPLLVNFIALHCLLDLFAKLRILSFTGTDHFIRSLFATILSVEREHKEGRVVQFPGKNLFCSR